MVSRHTDHASFAIISGFWFHIALQVCTSRMTGKKVLIPPYWCHSNCRMELSNKFKLPVKQSKRPLYYHEIGVSKLLLNHELWIDTIPTPHLGAALQVRESFVVVVYLCIPLNKTFWNSISTLSMAIAMSFVTEEINKRDPLVKFEGLSHCDHRSGREKSDIMWHDERRAAPRRASGVDIGMGIFTCRFYFAPSPLLLQNFVCNLSFLPDFNRYQKVIF